MDVQSLIKAAGKRQSDVAAAVRVSQGTMSKWVRLGIPAARVIEVSRATGIPAARLRPDLAAAFAEADT